jgi:hypothetical protein
MQFVSRVEDNGGEKEVEENRVLEGDHTLDQGAWTKTNNQPDYHSCH